MLARPNRLLSKVLPTLGRCFVSSQPISHRPPAQTRITFSSIYKYAFPIWNCFPTVLWRWLFRTAFPKIGETFSLPDRRWNSQNFWRRSGSEYPPESWTTLTEEKNKKLFWENQTGFHYFQETHRRMMLKQEMNFGPFHGSSFTVITLNRETNCTYREKNHSQFHFDTLTWSELLTQTWMWCIGISEETKTYLIRGLGSHDSPFRARASRWVYMVRRAVDEEPNDIQAWLVLARDMERHVRSNATKKWVIEKPKLGSAWRLRGVHFIDPVGADFKETIRNSAEEIGSSDASSNALQDQGKNVQGTCRKSWCSQDVIRMHRWSRRIYQKAFGRNSTQKSWSPHSRKKSFQ